MRTRSVATRAVRIFGSRESIPRRSLKWRKFRDAGVLAGKKPGEKIGRLTPEQAEIARLRRQLDTAQQRLATTEVALTIMGKAHELLEQLSKSSRDEPPHTKS